MNVSQANKYFIKISLQLSQSSNSSQGSQEVALCLIKVDVCHEGHTVEDETAGGFVPCWVTPPPGADVFVTGAAMRYAPPLPCWWPTLSARQTTISVIEKLRTLKGMQRFAVFFFLLQNKAAQFIKKPRQATGDDHPSVAQFVVCART